MDLTVHLGICQKVKSPFPARHSPDICGAAFCVDLPGSNLLPLERAERFLTGLYDLIKRFLPVQRPLDSIIGTGRTVFLEWRPLYICTADQTVVADAFGL